jgi:anti-sigma B factor antagonist
LIFRPLGAIDMTRAPSLRQELLDVLLRHPARLVVDLSRVEEIDSAVVATLVEALRIAHRDSGMLVLCGLRERVFSLFEIVRLDTSVFHIVATVDDAIALPNRRKFGRYITRSLQCDLGDVRDISAGGLKLWTTKKLKGTVRLKLWDEQTNMVVRARVMRCRQRRTGEYDTGLQFKDLGAEQAKKLAGILATVRETLSRDAA